MKVLLLGGGYLASHLISILKPFHQIDVITRTRQREAWLLSQGCRHFALDLRSSTFHFPLDSYQLLIFCPAVSPVDKMQENAKERLYVNGLQQILRNMDESEFKGKLIVIGSSSALQAPENWPDHLLTEEHLLLKEFSNSDPSYKQAQLFLDYVNTRKTSRHTLLLSTGIYGPSRHAGRRLLQGLSHINQDPERLLNLIHVEDLCAAIMHTYTSELRGVYLVSDGKPLTLREYYEKTAEILNFLPPVFTDDPFRNSQEEGTHVKIKSSSKRISNEKLLSTGFQLKYMTYLDCIRSVILQEQQNLQQ